jgi:hypothetical protein
MNPFECCNQAPPTEEEWIRREDHARTMERRLQEPANAAEYGRANAVEIPEFTGRRSPKMERMQMDFGFGEAA